jgi:hypothetical protein
LVADGGGILLQKKAGALLVTAFGTPRVGASEISVLVQRNGDPVLDAEVNVRVGESAAHAVHAANKLMYTAVLELARTGKTPIVITIGQVKVTGEVQVQPPVVYWPYYAVLPAAIALFALNQWLKSKRRVRRFATRP